MLKKISEFLVYSNIFIAACALALTYESFLLLHLPASLNWYLLLVFLCTLFVYNLHYYVKLQKNKTGSRLDWCRRHQKLLQVLIITSLIFIFGGVIYHFNSIFGTPGRWYYHNIAWFIIIPILALGYSYPLIPWKKKSLRQIGWLKMTSLSFIWSFTTVALPVFMLPDKGDVFTRTLFVPILFIYRFAFIAAISFLFNIRDQEEDKKDGIRTFAVLMGEKASLRYGKWIMFILNSLITLLVLWTFELQDYADYIAGFLPLLILFWYYQRFAIQKTEAVFVLQYDGLMLIKALLLIFAIRFFY
jgi:4-hydroxybenzoate polyprenyltransferase